MQLTGRTRRTSWQAVLFLGLTAGACGADRATGPAPLPEPPGDANRSGAIEITPTGAINFSPDAYSVTVAGLGTRAAVWGQVVRFEGVAPGKYGLELTLSDSRPAGAPRCRFQDGARREVNVQPGATAVVALIAICNADLPGRH